VRLAAGRPQHGRAEAVRGQQRQLDA